MGTPPNSMNGTMANGTMNSSSSHNMTSNSSNTTSNNTSHPPSHQQPWSPGSSHCSSLQFFDHLATITYKFNLPNSDLQLLQTP